MMMSDRPMRTDLTGNFSEARVIKTGSADRVECDYNGDDKVWQVRINWFVVAEFDSKIPAMACRDGVRSAIEHFAEGCHRLLTHTTDDELSMFISQLRGAMPKEPEVRVFE